MTELIKNYIKSCKLVEKRISELTDLRSSLLKNGNSSRADELNLDRRIRVLYEEHGELKAIIAHLTSYNRRLERHVEM